MKKIGIIGDPDITAHIAERLNNDGVEVIQMPPDNHVGLNEASTVSGRVMQIVDTYKNYMNFLPTGKRMRILRYYNPDYDKARVGRNDPCTCRSGKKFKNCCINKRYEEDI